MGADSGDNERIAWELDDGWNDCFGKIWRFLIFSILARLRAKRAHMIHTMYVRSYTTYEYETNFIRTFYHRHFSLRVDIVSFPRREYKRRDINQQRNTLITAEDLIKSC